MLIQKIYICGNAYPKKKKEKKKTMWCNVSLGIKNLISYN